MKKSRFTESQIVAILKEGEAGVGVAQLARKHGISAATDHGMPIMRACQAARLSRATYYWPGIDQAARDAEVITALQKPRSSSIFRYIASV
jgi:Transposase